LLIWPSLYLVAKYHQSHRSRSPSVMSPRAFYDTRSASSCQSMCIFRSRHRWDMSSRCTDIHISTFRSHFVSKLR
jgi:hypothetical protein